MANGCVVNSERGIDGGSDVLGINGTLFRPSRIVHVGAIGRGVPQHVSAAYSATRDQRGMNEIMISSLPVRDVSNSASEFTLNDNQGFIELCPASTPRHRCQIGQKVSEPNVELACRTIDSRVCCVDVLMVVPTTERDLDVARTEIRGNDIARRDTGISKRVVAIPLLIGG